MVIWQILDVQESIEIICPVNMTKAWKEITGDAWKDLHISSRLGIGKQSFQFPVTNSILPGVDINSHRNNLFDISSLHNRLFNDTVIPNGLSGILGSIGDIWNFVT